MSYDIHIRVKPRWVRNSGSSIKNFKKLSEVLSLPFHYFWKPAEGDPADHFGACNTYIWLTNIVVTCTPSWKSDGETWSTPLRLKM